jgi:hypothetical protein
MCFIPPRDRHAVPLQQSENVFAVLPFVILDLLHRRLRLGSLQRGRMADVGKGRGAFGLSADPVARATGLSIDGRVK